MDEENLIESSEESPEPTLPKKSTLERWKPYFLFLAAIFCLYSITFYHLNNSWFWGTDEFEIEFLNPVAQCKNGHVTDRLVYFTVFDDVNNISAHENLFLQERVNLQGRHGKLHFEEDETETVEIFLDHESRIIKRQKKNIPIISDSWIKGNILHAIVNLAYIYRPPELIKARGGYKDLFINATWTCGLESSRPSTISPNTTTTTIESHPFQHVYTFRKGRKNDYLHIVCDFPDDSLKNYVSKQKTVDDPNEPIFFSLKAISSENLPLLHYKEAPSCNIETFDLPAAKKENRIEICIMINGDNIHFLSEWIAYHRIIGVDHIHVYANENPAPFFHLLQGYIDAGFLTLIDWNSLSRFNPEDELNPNGFFDQLAQIGSCIHRLEGMTEFVGIWDVDEFVQVLDKDKSFKETFNSPICGFDKRTGSADISSQFYGCYNDTDFNGTFYPSDNIITCNENTAYPIDGSSNKLTGLSILNDAVYRASKPVKRRKKKLIVRPESVTVSSVHVVMAHIEGYKAKSCKAKNIKLVHFKRALEGVFRLETMRNKMPKGYSSEPITQDLTLQKWVPKIIDFIAKYENANYCSKNPSICGLYSNTIVGPSNITSSQEKATT